MAVSKRLRYEVLRRDGHACRYCGGAAPSVTLTVDHVVPVALGGTDDPGNLVTACAPCNSGKSASAPDAPLVREVDEAALRWSRAMARAAERMLADLDEREQLWNEFDQVWCRWGLSPQRLPAPRPPDWQQSVESLVAAGLPMPVLAEAVRLAMGNSKVVLDSKWRYMCGIAWRKVTELQQVAQQLADAPEVEPTLAIRPDTALAGRLLREYFEEDTESLLRQAVEDAGDDLDSHDALIAAAEIGIGRLADQQFRLVTVVGWVLAAIVQDQREELLRIARAEFEQYEGVGQFSDLDVEVRAVYLLTHPGGAAPVAAEPEPGDD